MDLPLAVLKTRVLSDPAISFAEVAIFCSLCSSMERDDVSPFGFGHGRPFPEPSSAGPEIPRAATRAVERESVKEGHGWFL